MSGRIRIAWAAAALASLAVGQRPRLSVASAGDRAPGSLEDTLVALEKRSWEAWKARDGKYFQEFLSEDHVDVGARGVVDKAHVVAGVASPACVVESYAVDSFAVLRYDARTALLTYRAEQKTMCGGNPVPSPVWVSGLFLERGGRWVNALHQQSPARTR
ncbi:MAG: nuclear transport factor 2 family protein [Gemmatimonadota bacterium]